ncbi:glutathione S-transferase [Halopseudomonas oceani]|uniref:Glutathione S-transferase family protein n=1 Tax=Halopseudomonas oceani TaxID=1708783 RepID=A0A2P4EU31_9GAMM|nr:glutathione S-transferase family protein [Halopseudomonas oceani]POB02957.1 glutathione S-transferase family protein [Halopseudomonas oceani]GGE50029.1 glutathione S-transferase [Halopseudomonas oceani]
MALTLYGAILSPFVRKVRILLAEHQIPYEHTFIPPRGQPDWYYDISPLGRIPAMVDGDVKLADSAVIAQYLQDSRGGPSLYGTTPEDAARVRWIEKYADYELAPHCTFAVFFTRIVACSVGEQADESRAQTALIKHLPPLFDYLEGELGDRKYFLGEQFSIADIAVVCQLINMAHGGELIDEQRWPGLSSLLSRVTARESVSALLPAEHQLVARLSGRI